MNVKKPVVPGSQNQVRADFEKWVMKNCIVDHNTFSTNLYGQYTWQAYITSSGSYVWLQGMWMAYLAGRASK